jgi:ATP-dependent Clp protease ATP-binding subunit ClpC
MNLKSNYEDFHGVNYSEDVIKMCLKLTSRYVTERFFPDKAIDALDEIGSAVKIGVKVPDTILAKQVELEEVTALKLSNVKNEDFEKAAEYRTLEIKVEKELKEMKLNVNKDKGSRIDVTTEDVAEVIATMTGIPSKNISEDDTSKLVGLNKNLCGQIIGQDDAVEKISKAILRNKAGIGDTDRPIGTFMFLGPTGVGKTYLAKMLAKELFTSTSDMIRIDMSEYMEKHSVARLIGAPPGYVGHEDGGQLTDAVRKNPYSIVLLDEIEKAHSDVSNILLQVFEDGLLTDSQGRTVDFKNTIIIMTSNVGSRDAKQRGSSIGFSDTSDKSLSASVVEKALNKKFAPEFINRIDEVISFNSLDEANIKTIIGLEIKQFTKKLTDMGITLDLDDSAKEFLFEKGWDADMGARPLKRAIVRYIEDDISMMVITKSVKTGDTLVVSRAGKDLGDDEKLLFANTSELLSLNPIKDAISGGVSNDSSNDSD